MREMTQHVNQQFASANVHLGFSSSTAVNTEMELFINTALENKLQLLVSH